jgi:hypothetical protein
VVGERGRCGWEGGEGGGGRKDEVGCWREKVDCRRARGIWGGGVGRRGKGRRQEGPWEDGDGTRGKGGNGMEEGE